MNAAYAADGYARLNSLAALVVTNGVTAIAGRLDKTKSPAILAHLDVDLFGSVWHVLALANVLHCPIAVMNTSKGVIDESAPAYAGIYSEAGSQTAARDAVEGSDCLLAIGH